MASWQDLCLVNVWIAAVSLGQKKHVSCKATEWQQFLALVKPSLTWWWLHLIFPSAFQSSQGLFYTFWDSACCQSVSEAAPLKQKHYLQWMRFPHHSGIFFFFISSLRDSLGSGNNDIEGRDFNCAAAEIAEVVVRAAKAEITYIWSVRHGGWGSKKDRQTDVSSGYIMRTLEP